MTDLAKGGATERITEHLAAVLAAEQRSNAFKQDLGYALANAGGAASQVNVTDAVTAISGYVETIPAVLSRIEQNSGDPEAGRLLILMQSCFLAGPGTIGRMGLAGLLPQAYAAWQLMILANEGSAEPMPAGAMSVHQMVGGLLGPEMAASVNTAVAEALHRNDFERLARLHPASPVPFRTVGTPTRTAVTAAPFTVTARSTAPEAIDTSFGRDGVSVTGVRDGSGRAAAVQTDGGIVVAGVSTGDHAQKAVTVARYGKDGQAGSCVRLELAYPDDARGDCTAHAIALQADGSTLVAGTAYQPPDLANGMDDMFVARLTADGRLDPTFGGTGWLQIGVGLSSRAAAVVADPTGTIVAAGYLRDQLSGTFQTCLVRLTADGKPDRSFGIDGFALFPATANEEAVSMVAVPGGYAVLAKRSAGTSSGFAMLKVGADGRLDPAFGDGGRSTFELGAGDNVPTALAVRPDGRYLAAGYLDNRSYVMLCVDAQGGIDSTFGDAGLVKGHFSESKASFAYALAVDEDGAILLGGGLTERATQAGYVGSMPTYDTDRSFALARFTASGSLDEAFGVNGVVLTDLGEGINEIAAMVLTGSGVVCAGTSAGGIAVARFHSAPTPSDTDAVEAIEAVEAVGVVPEAADEAALHASTRDTAELPTIPSETADTAEFPTLAPETSRRWVDATFNGSGAAIWPFPGSSSHPQAVAVQKDGAIVVAGAVDDPGREGGRDIGVLRLLPDGHLDETFGTGGHKIVHVSGANTVAHAVAIQPDGHIVVAGEILDTTTEFALVRLDPTGAVDTTFQGGLITAGFVGGDSVAYAVAIQDDGKIVAAGYATDAASEFFAVARYNPDGTPDPAFATDGLATTAFAGATARARCLHIGSDGSILAAGYARTDTDWDVAAVRYRPDGRPDPAFGDSGRAYLPVEGTKDVAYALAVTDDAVVLAGSAQGEPRRHVLLCSLTPSGTPNEAFGTAGRVVVDDFIGAASGLVVLPDGRIVVAGYAELEETDQFALVCCHPDGARDSSFGSDGVLLVDLGGTDGACAIAAQPDGKLVVAGASRTRQASDFAVIRIDKP